MARGRECWAPGVWLQKSCRSMGVLAEVRMWKLFVMCWHNWQQSLHTTISFFKYFLPQTASLFCGVILQTPCSVFCVCLGHEAGMGVVPGSCLDDSALPTIRSGLQSPLSCPWSFVQRSIPPSLQAVVLSEPSPLDCSPPARHHHPLAGLPSHIGCQSKKLVFKFVFKFQFVNMHCNVSGVQHSDSASHRSPPAQHSLIHITHFLFHSACVFLFSLQVKV